MNITELKKLNDRQLVSIIKTTDNQDLAYNKASEVLYERYSRQIHKNWWKLRAQMNNSQIVESLKEEYYSEAEEAFWTAIQKINLDKVRDDNWKCVGYIDFYLRNVRTKLIKKTEQLSKNKSTTSMKEEEGEDGSLMVDPDVERAYWENDGYKTEPSYVYEVREGEENCARAIQTCMSHWSPLKQEVFNYLQDGKSKAEIARITQENPMKIYQIASDMKKDMKIALGI